jgi:thiamine-monophosphate kinase
MTMASAPSGMGEFELIQHFFARHPTTRRGPGVILGIGDDAALLELPPGADLVASVDTIVAGRHFLDSTGARSIGHRALAVNLSDMAAMGATPLWVTLALTLPSVDPDWLGQFAAGFLELADAHEVTLVGGDTTRGPLTVSVQIMGHVPHGTALRRNGAQVGDVLAVSGTLGDAAAGLSLLKARQMRGREPDELIRRFDFPEPRVALGLRARGLATAAMDLSDGLIGDLPKLAQASSLAAHVNVERLPLSSAMSATMAADDALNLALAGGDD